MATTRKVLGQVGSPTAATITDLYTVPALTDTVVSSIVACNTSATPTTIRITVAPAGAADAAAHRIVDTLQINGNETITFSLGITLATTDKIRVLNTLATVNFHAFGQENT